MNAEWDRTAEWEVIFSDRVRIRGGTFIFMMTILTANILIIGAYHMFLRDWIARQAYEQAIADVKSEALYVMDCPGHAISSIINPSKGTLTCVYEATPYSKAIQSYTWRYK